MATKPKRALAYLASEAGPETIMPFERMGGKLRVMKPSGAGVAVNMTVANKVPGWTAARLLRRSRLALEMDRLRARVANIDHAIAVEEGKAKPVLRRDARRRARRG